MSSNIIAMHFGVIAFGAGYYQSQEFLPIVSFFLPLVLLPLVVV